MDEFSFLETTAEIAIAFTGFISVFFILARQTGSFHPRIAMSIRVVLIAGITCPFLSALPLILVDLEVEPTAVWRISSGATLALGLTMSTYLFKNRNRFAGAPAIQLIFANVLNFFSLILPLANVIGFPSEPNSALHLASIWLILGIASINFVGLVLFILNKPD
ncbi:MAG: hypothetical protein AAF541_06905 [Pseudomonadota bacterium]